MTAVPMLRVAAVAALFVANPAASYAQEAAAEVREEALPAVTVATAQQTEVLSVVPVAGTIRPVREVMVVPQIGGYQIIQVIGEIGDRVTRGQVVVKLRSEALEAQLAQAEASLASAEAQVRQAQNQITSTEAAQAQAEAELSRYERLKAQGNVSQAAYDQIVVSAENARAAALSARDQLAIAEASKQQAIASRDVARLNLSWAQITSPVDGVISSKDASVGQITSLGGSPLFTIIENGTVEFQGEVIETAIGEIEPGDPATLRVAGVGELTGLVRLVPPSVDPVTRLGMVEVTPEGNPNLRAGLFASGEIVTEKRQALTVPISAVLSDAEGAFVQVVADGKVERRGVQPGLIWQDRQEVVDGVMEGETVIERAGAFFRTGDRVRTVVPGEAGK